MISAWNSGMPETVCGRGSTLKNTEAIRNWLPVLVNSYNIKTVADVGCGDQNWVKHVRWAVEYEGFDVEHTEPSFNCVMQTLPQAFDLIMCVYVLNHLYADGEIDMALARFRKSGSRWLLATFNDVAGFPLEPVCQMLHKEKKSGDVVRQWSYGLFELNKI